MGALSALAVVATTLPAFGAGTGYTGSGGGGTGLPGLPGAIVTTCSYTGAALTCTASIGGYTITVSVPAGDLAPGSQIVITTVTNPVTISGLLLLAFGVGDYLNGTKVTTTFSQPLTITVTGPGLSSSSTCYGQFSTGGPTTVPSTVANGSITFSMPSDPTYQIDNPAAPAATSAVSGATVPVTGEPFLGEELLAGLLVGFGSLLLIGLRLRRRTPATVSNDS